MKFKYFMAFATVVTFNSALQATGISESDRREGDSFLAKARDCLDNLKVECLMGIDYSVMDKSSNPALNHETKEYWQQINREIKKLRAEGETGLIKAMQEKNTAAIGLIRACQGSVSECGSKIKDPAVKAATQLAVLEMKRSDGAYRSAYNDNRDKAGLTVYNERVFVSPELKTEVKLNNSLGTCAARNVWERSPGKIPSYFSQGGIYTNFHWQLILGEFNAFRKEACDPEKLNGMSSAQIIEHLHFDFTERLIAAKKNEEEKFILNLGKSYPPLSLF